MFSIAAIKIINGYLAHKKLATGINQKRYDFTCTQVRIEEISNLNFQNDLQQFYIFFASSRFYLTRLRDGGETDAKWTCITSNSKVIYCKNIYCKSG